MKILKLTLMIGFACVPPLHILSADPLEIAARSTHSSRTQSTSGGSESKYNANIKKFDDRALDNSIQVGAPNTRKIKIAIPTFLQDVDLPEGALTNGPLPRGPILPPVVMSESEKLPTRFTELLEFTNWFEIISTEHRQKNLRPFLKPFDAAYWKSLNTDYVMSGTIFNPKNNQSKQRTVFDLNLKLYNVKSGKIIYESIYRNQDSLTANESIKKFGDDMLYSLTGVVGPFMSYITFSATKNAKDDKAQIYIADIDGKNLRQISHNDSTNMSPAWSPDGIKITYTSFISGRPEIYQYNILTDRTFKMTHSKEGSNSGASWSSDGKTVAFSSGNHEGKTHIYSMTSTGRNIKAMLNLSEIEVEPSFSPDGNYLAFTSNRYVHPMIFLKNLKDQSTKRLTYAGWYNASANWKPDSSAISFASYDREVDRWDIFKINIDGQGFERLTLKQGDNEKPTWSPDGRFIIFQTDRATPNSNTRGKQSHLYVMNPEGDNQKMLNIPLYSVKQPNWSSRIKR